MNDGGWQKVDAWELLAALEAVFIAAGGTIA